MILNGDHLQCFMQWAGLTSAFYGKYCRMFVYSMVRRKRLGSFWTNGFALRMPTLYTGRYCLDRYIF